MTRIHVTAGMAATVGGLAALLLAVPAEAQWGGYGGRGQHGGRHCPMGDCGYHRPRPPGGGGKICYNFAGRPYVYKGRGRCPIS
ncbi:hypothetical protein [Methylobacterium nonmethylotrophicum]|uniref:Sulfur globule protein n=1 Tax=Methylobacterium nonmethylotrophicum TaxID=1141884 RepID=A0A4Z0NJR2_9HYPH|nr:hypothetical protein [Methylobacterium nonmethylotrophicum]TGD96084.1 hypothetical protein EU555_25360 [Methylobacterium nonmethylotrophicum]